MIVTETERPEVFWVDVTSKHVVDAMNGKDVEARFRDRADGPWTSVRKLKGWSKFKADNWFHDGSIAWNFCQVYEPQSWWLNKPDPGPGCRLLDKFPDEELKPGDEFFQYGKWWPVFLEDAYPQVREIWFRRHIESLEAEPKHKVDDRVRIIGPVPRQKVNKNWERGMDALVGRIVRVKSKRLSVLDDGSSAWFYTVENIYEYVVREDYLAPAPPAPPSHPMCRCEIAPKPIKPVEGAAHYPKIGDTIFLPEMGRLKVLARGVEVC